MKLHYKGYLLVTISKSGGIWDQQLIEKVFNEYNESGDFREKTIRIALDELAAAGLIKRIENKLETINAKEKLLFKYQVSDFGISRMVDTGLLLP
jgi:DNA-binding transcriptional regulator PaaX